MSLLKRGGQDEIDSESEKHRDFSAELKMMRIELRRVMDHLSQWSEVSIKEELARSSCESHSKMIGDLQECLAAFHVKLLADLSCRAQVSIDEPGTSATDSIRPEKPSAPKPRLAFSGLPSAGNIRPRRPSSTKARPALSVRVWENGAEAVLPGKVFPEQPAQPLAPPKSLEIESNSEDRDESQDGDSEVEEVGNRKVLFGVNPNEPDNSNKESDSNKGMAAQAKHRQSINAGTLGKSLTLAQQELEAPPLNELSLWQRIERIVKHSMFDTVMGIVLAINAMVLGVQVEMNARGFQAADAFQDVNAVFCCIFTFELLARMAVYQKKFFFSEEWTWNLFDTVLVIVLLADLIIASTDSSGKSSGTLAIMKILRLGRVMRLLRMVRLVSGLKHLVYLIVASMSSFLWTAVLTLMMMYCFGLFLTDQTTEYVRVHSNSATFDPNILAYWGTVGDSIRTLFIAMTGGANWADLIVCFGEDAWASNVVFYIFITFATMVMLNLVTGVFVEGAQRIVKEDKDADIIKMAVKAFALVDINNNGTLTFEEFESSLEDDSLVGFFDTVGITPEDGQDIFKLLDKDGSGEVSVLEFVDGCLRLKGPARALDLASLMISVRSIEDDLKVILRSRSRASRPSRYSNSSKKAY